MDRDSDFWKAAQETAKLFLKLAFVSFVLWLLATHPAHGSC